MIGTSSPPMDCSGKDRERTPAAERCDRLFQMVTDAIPSSVLLVDQQLRIVQVNRNFLKKARRTREEVLMAPLGEVFSPVILDEMDLETSIRQVFFSGYPLKGRSLSYRAPGISRRVYYYSLIPVRRGEVTEQVMLLMEDITEQVRLSETVRRAESHLASVVECASDFVVSTDPRGGIISWNGAVERATGFRLEEVRGDLFTKYFHGEHQDRVQEVFTRLEELGSLTQTEWSLTTKDDKTVPVSWVWSAMRRSRGEVEGVVAVGRDLTERRKLEMQVLQSQKLAALGVMAGGIAHEIRNPLAAASSAAQFLLEEDLQPDLTRECARRINNGIHRASAIIENLLRFARPSSSMEAMMALDLGKVTSDTVALVANDARLQNIEISMNTPSEPILINGLPQMVQQLVMNLLLNALQAMPGGGSLHVHLSRTKGTALLRVSDSGCGIPKEDLDKIFDPFYTTQPVGQGTGLGLSLCYSIAMQHFGTIEVESCPGETTFTVRLPLIQQRATP